MPTIERTAYPRFGSNPSKSKLTRLYTPTFEEIELAKRTTRGEYPSLTFLVMLKSFQRLGRFPKPEEVPESVVSRVRSSLGLPEDELETAPAETLTAPERSLRRYRDAIREYLEVKAVRYNRKLWIELSKGTRCTFPMELTERSGVVAPVGRKHRYGQTTSGRRRPRAKPARSRRDRSSGSA